MDTRVADVTVSVAGGLVTHPDVAVIDVVPAVVRAVASPLVPWELLMVATAGFGGRPGDCWVITLVLLSA